MSRDAQLLPPYLKSRRNQPLTPAKLMQPIADALQQLAEYAAAVGDVVEDSRWPEAAAAFERAAGCLRNPNNVDKENA